MHSKYNIVCWFKYYSKRGQEPQLLICFAYALEMYLTNCDMQSIDDLCTSLSSKIG